MSDMWWLSSWIVNFMSTASFFLWWCVSTVLHTKYHIRGKHYFLWVIVSGPLYGFVTWVLFTFLWVIGETIFEQGWHSFVNEFYVVSV